MSKESTVKRLLRKLHLQKFDESEHIKKEDLDKVDVKEEQKERKIDPNTPLFDIDLETKKLNQFVALALDPAEGKEWTEHKPKNVGKGVNIKHTQLPEDKLYTVRGQMEGDMKLDTFWEFVHGDFDDIFTFVMEVDEMAKDLHAVHRIDADHTVVYGSFNAGHGLWPRDFCYMKRRFKFENHEGPDGKKYRIGGVLLYSLDEKHPYFVQRAKGHVRGWLHMSGDVIVEKSDKVCVLNHIVNLRPGGWIPKWVANAVAPKQGLVVKIVHDGWHKIEATVNKRGKDANDTNDTNDANDGNQNTKETKENGDESATETQKKSADDVNEQPQKEQAGAEETQATVTENMKI